jgi:subtilisin family serine protease
MVAGIVAAAPDRVPGFQGVAPEVRLLSLKACQPISRQSVRAQCWSSSLAKAVDRAVTLRAAVINLSVAGRADDTLLGRIVAAASRGVEQALDAASRQGAVVIAAAGNDGPAGAPSFPAVLEQVLAVTAVDSRMTLYPYATRGSFVAVAAPGVEVVSSAPGNLFPVCSGTSFATAYASGVAALLLQQNPKLSPHDLRTYMEQTARDLGPAGRDPEFGFGLLDICSALARVNPSLSCR